MDSIGRDRNSGETETFNIQIKICFLGFNLFIFINLIFLLYIGLSVIACSNRSNFIFYIFSNHFNLFLFTMSEELCKCFVCLKENADGVLVSKRTYNRHRKNQQEFLEETNINQLAQNVEDVHQQVDLRQDLHQREDLHQDYQQEDMIICQQGNIYQQDEGFNTNNTDDTESFSFNEEDNECYSDYNIEEHDDDDDDMADEDDDMANEDDDMANEDDDMANEDDDMANEDDDDMTNKDDDTMQTDTTTPNKKMIEGLKLLYLKSLYNFTESAYDDIMKVFTTNNLSLYKVKKYLIEVTGLVPVFYDMCENSCICYTEQYESYQNCPICNSARYSDSTRRKAKKVMPYLSIKDRLKTQFSDENRAKELLYRHEYIRNKSDNDLDDIFDGKIYKELVDENLFSDKRDIVFTASCDGYQIFKQKTDDCWLFLMINNNLDPFLRVKKENLLVPFLIPGPNQPKDFNTFLRPFVDEMKELEGKNFLIFDYYLKTELK